jgi:hypothetical protein
VFAEKCPLGRRIRARWRHFEKARPKNPEKIIKDGAKSGGKWRFSKGQSAIFAVL